MFGINVKNESLLQNEYQIISNFVTENNNNVEENNNNDTSEGTNTPKERPIRGKRNGRKVDNSGIVKRASTMLDENVSYKRLEQAIPVEYVENFEKLKDNGIISLMC